MFRYSYIYIKHHKMYIIMTESCTIFNFKNLIYNRNKRKTTCGISCKNNFVINNTQVLFIVNGVRRARSELL